jgi:hypothetical protein
MANKEVHKNIEEGGGKRTSYKFAPRKPHLELQYQQKTFMLLS